MDASADTDVPLQESKQGTMIIKTVFCGLCYILKLDEFYCTCKIYVDYILILSVTGCLG